LPVITTSSQGTSNLNDFHSIIENYNYPPKPCPEPITITEFIETLQSSTVSLASKWLGAVYVSLPCLPPDLASSLENIF